MAATDSGDMKIGPVTFLLLAAASLDAQAVVPAPAGETAAAFAAAEAMAFVSAQQLASVWRDGENAFRGRPWQAPDWYQLRMARRDADGSWQWLDEGADPARALAAGDGIAYLLPTDPGARRLFCVRGDGVAACSDNRVGTLVRGGREAAPDDVLGEGGNGSALDFPRSPQRGRDGNLWTPADMVRQQPVRVRVVDERGAPMAGVRLDTCVAAPGAGIDALLPAGGGRTLLEGDTGWSGVPARGLGFQLTMEGVTMDLAAELVVVEGRSVRVQVLRSVVQRLRLSRNESAAIATLKNISSAQAQCQACGVIDQNQNGAGEYGSFAELAGRVGVRGGGAKISPPVLSTAFGNVENGIVTRSGYCFRMLLPGKDGVAVPELANGGADAAKLDATEAEVSWCVYAWPVEPGVTGERAFFIDQHGDVMGCRNGEGRYAGTRQMPAPDAARAATSKGTMSDANAANSQGRDGETWVIIS